MSAPYRHACGQQLHASTHSALAGLDHSINLTDPDTGGRVTRCPRCHAELPAALRDGSLAEMGTQNESTEEATV